MLDRPNLESGQKHVYTNPNSVIMINHWRLALACGFLFVICDQETGKKVYYHFEGQPAQSVIDKMKEYSNRYGI